MRVGTIRAGWPRPWIGAWWSSNRRDEGWPPLPFDEDLGHGLEGAANRFLSGRDQPNYMVFQEGLVFDLLVLSAPWWVVLTLCAVMRERRSPDDQPGNSGTTN